MYFMIYVLRSRDNGWHVGILYHPLFIWPSHGSVHSCEIGATHFRAPFYRLWISLDQAKIVVVVFTFLYFYPTFRRIRFVLILDRCAVFFEPFGMRLVDIVEKLINIIVYSLKCVTCARHLADTLLLYRCRTFDFSSVSCKTLKIDTRQRYDVIYSCSTVLCFEILTKFLLVENEDLIVIVNRRLALNKKIITIGLFYFIREIIVYWRYEIKLLYEFVQ